MAGPPTEPSSPAVDLTPSQRRLARVLAMGGTPTREWLRQQGVMVTDAEEDVLLAVHEGRAVRDPGNAADAMAAAVARRTDLQALARRQRLDGPLLIVTSLLLIVGGSATITFWIIDHRNTYLSVTSLLACAFPFLNQLGRRHLARDTEERLARLEASDAANRVLLGATGEAEPTNDGDDRG